MWQATRKDAIVIVTMRMYIVLINHAHTHTHTQKNIKKYLKKQNIAELYKQNQ